MMMRKILDDIGNLLMYDPETGLFTWKVSRGGVRAGTQAGYDSGRGYIIIRVLGRNYYAHRIAFLLMTGQWPEYQIDHINGNRSDNRFCNLRPATPAENRQNSEKREVASSGYIGVHYSNRSNRWIAKIQVRGKVTHLGTFVTEEEAAEAYIKAKKQLHKFQPTVRGIKDES